jgi:VIT1/CCC1 family predicted Fe2+/Mn2+ transporter
MEPRTDLWLANLVDERDGAALYAGLATAERDPVRAATFRRFADAERRHTEVWEKKLKQVGVALPPDRPSSRVRMLVWMAQHLGTAAVIPFVIADEASNADKYAAQGGDAAGMAEEEREHEVELGRLRGDESEPRAIIANRERWHRAGRAGGVRAAVFGMNDGIVSNLSLVLGVAGAGADRHTLLVTGLSGLLAGACSMAVGEYTSVASQRDLLVRQIDLERREIAEGAEEEAAELAQILMHKGLTAQQAEEAASQILKDPEHALDMLVREELGLDPADLGSPIGAASSSFATFAFGAFVPLSPFLFGHGAGAPVTSAVLSAIVLGVVGALVGVLSGSSGTRAALRMIALAALAAGITFGVGRLFGVVAS